MRWTAVATTAGVAYALGRLAGQARVAAARREASTDSLTGLPNRLALTRQLRNRAKRGHPYAIYLLDLNDFKPVNDRHGHRAGDALLRALAGRLTDTLGAAEVYRLGGDEFVVVSALPGHAGLAAAIQQAVAMPVALAAGAGAVQVTAAVGYVVVAPGMDYRAALHAADLAMYRSKSAGSPCRAGVVSPGRVDESPQLRIRDARGVRVA